MLDVILAVLTVLGFVVGILHWVTFVLDRRRRAGEAKPDRVSFATELRRGDVSDSERLHSNDNAAGDPSFEPSAASIERGAVAWRACLAYILGLIGAIFFWRNSRLAVRFHAAQALLIDASAALYAVVACCGLVLYVAIRYPDAGESGQSEISSNDPVMWAWIITVFLGAPAFRALLAVVVLFGGQPKVPIIWRIAASLAARPKAKQE